MQGYGRDEYEGYDEYGEDVEEQEEEEVEGEYEEETYQPTHQELEYLELRRQLKESIRKQMKKELGTANVVSRDKINGVRQDNFGNFFGPSLPVISQRVIQESKSLLENPDLAARISRPNRPDNKSSVSDPAKSKPRDKHPPRVTNGLKKKVEILKDTRDYSFLLSDDAEVPTSSKSLPPKNISAPKTAARPTQEQSPRSRQVVNGRGGEAAASNVRKKPMHSSSQNKPKVGPERTIPARKSLMEPLKQLRNSNGSGPGRPVGPPKDMPAKSPVSGKLNPAVAKNMSGGAHRPPPSSTASKLMPINLQRSIHKPPPIRGQPSVLRKPSGQREYQESRKPKVVTKQALRFSTDQVKKPPHKPAARHSLVDERPKAKPKRPFNDEDSDGENAINMIRKMFRYNPNKFHDDHDVSDMEANFHDIMREERRSAKIARREDEEQSRLIEEEARREKMLAKKRKLGHK